VPLHSPDLVGEPSIRVIDDAGDEEQFDDLPGPRRTPLSTQISPVMIRPLWRR